MTQVCFDGRRSVGKTRLKGNPPSSSRFMSFLEDRGKGCYGMAELSNDVAFVGYDFVFVFCFFLRGGGVYKISLLLDS